MDAALVASFKAYADAWSSDLERDDRRKLLQRSWAPTGSLFDPETPGGLIGIEALLDYIAATHQELPGLVVVDTSEPEVLGERLRVPWEARQDGVRLYTGTDFVEFAPDGRISRLTMFYDSTPD
jgi:hypothetical protein